MSTINELMNNLETLKLTNVKENINQYLDMVSDGVKTPLDAINELIKIEITSREEMAIISCVKVANFSFQREIKDFDFNYQPSLDRNKILDLATLRFIETNENIIFCGTPGTGNYVKKEIM